MTGPLQLAIAGLLVLTFVLPANAGPREQAKRIHDRLAGVPAETGGLPSDDVLQRMEDIIATNGSDPLCPSGVTGAACAAYVAMDNVNFYNVCLLYTSDAADDYFWV